MQAAHPPTRSAELLRKLSWFLAAPLTAAIIITVAAAVLAGVYQQQHAGRIFTGVSLWGVDLSGLDSTQAKAALSEVFPYPDQELISVIDQESGKEWLYTPADLGITVDWEAAFDAAYEVGRQGGPLERLGQQFDTWYFGKLLAPIVVFDEGQLDKVIAGLSAEINRPAVDAALIFNGSNVNFVPPQVGLSLDEADTRERLALPVEHLQAAQIELLVHETPPRVSDASQAAGEIEQIMSGPMTLYLQEPLSGTDLQKVVIPVDELAKWIRIQTVETPTGEATTEVFLDENAVRTWLVQYEKSLYREPVNARYYFDDNTRELVLVEPHINGRELDIEATTAQVVDQVFTSNRTLPFIMREIIPVVHSRATAAELGITELVSESTTWFRGSSDERKHNIARAASDFYGIVIAPGEEFSFNHFLGEVSIEGGYESGLIIFGGRTVEGVGGGICQVSTTAFQAAFWAGYPIGERWEHGYRVGYYDDGEGPGMDATVYSPLIDLRFINDTPYHLLIENYYNEANSSLTFKFYSTSLGRVIEKEGPFIENMVPAKPDIWELNEELEPGEIEQVDWAVDGSDVTVNRRVYNANGELIRQDEFTSHYIPWQNIYQYGPGTELEPGTGLSAESPDEA